jgi:hypothetical protein
MRAAITRSLLMGLAAGMVSASLAEAQVTATVVLKSGERHSGVNLNYRLDRGRVVVRESGNEPSFSEDQVAFVEFASVAAPSNLSLNGQEAVQLRDGSVLRGNLVEMGHGTNGDLSTPFLVIIDTDGGQKRLDAGQVARVYFSGGTATGVTTTTRNRDESIVAAAAGGRARAEKHVTVAATQAWTPTGIQVRRNEQVTIAGSGQVDIASGGAPASVSGGNDMNPANALATAKTGALIGRIGNGQPFLIGERTTFRATDNGQLLLGVNDSHHGDNSGAFEVDVVVNGGRSN